jgi:(p)ppGpp synthase/HD superfamily hydrolase
VSADPIDATPSLTTPGPRFARAVEWASSLHADQRRKGSDTPYIAHLLEVAALTLAGGGNETEAVAALLHDSIEDASMSPKKLRRHFGGKVSKIVVACTETVGDAHGESVKKRARHHTAANWRARKEQTLARLADPATPTAVLRVQAADALANGRAIVADLRRIGPETWQRFNAGAVDQLWYYRSLAIVLTYRLPGYLSHELRATVREMEQIAGWWFDVGDPQPGKR